MFLQNSSKVKQYHEFKKQNVKNDVGFYHWKTYKSKFPIINFKDVQLNIDFGGLLSSSAEYRNVADIIIFSRFS